MILSELSSKIEGQPMFKIIEQVRSLESRGEDIIHLEIGDPNFNTPIEIKKACIKAIESNYTHYCSSWGIEEFVEEIINTTLKTRKFKPVKGQVLVTPGANIVIFYAVFLLANRNDEVLTPDPGFPTYHAAIKMCGAKPVYYKLNYENEFKVRYKEIEKLITCKTKLIILNTPSNPTGAVFEDDELNGLLDLAKKNNIVILSDEIYSSMIYDEKEFHSVSTNDLCRENVILLNGFSKSFAMTGWRLGTVIGPEEIMERMMLLVQTTSSCVSPFIQKAGIAAIELDRMLLKPMLNQYDKRRKLVVDGLNNIDGIQCHLPGGAFYAFPNISEFGLGSLEFCDYILNEAKVAILPGIHFGNDSDSYIRICYAQKSEKLKEALKRIKKACKKL